MRVYTLGEKVGLLVVACVLAVPAMVASLVDYARGGRMR